MNFLYEFLINSLKQQRDMTSYLISKFGENFSKEYLNSIISIKKDYIRNDIIKYILNKNNKVAILFWFKMIWYQNQ